MNDRIEHAQAYVHRLLSTEAHEAVVRDGWSAEMVAEGFACHRTTWDVPTLMNVVAAERPDHSAPASVAHIWPALPGAGVTPLLYSYLIGVPLNAIHASRRGAHFGAYALQHAPEGIGEGDWRDADIVVVSGSDETVASVTREARGRVIGYGHRVSIAVVSPAVDVRALARDAVLWHQQGCFSLRGVVLVGSTSPTEFAQTLSEAIAEAEDELGASLNEAQSAQRAQALGVAEFEGKVARARFGFVVHTDAPLDGRWRSPHAVQLAAVDTVDGTARAIGIPPSQLQGVATDVFARACDALGATRICAPGQLQAPPGDWPHDGKPNVSIYF